MLKGIIFDMDGVLINTEPLHYQVWKRAFEKRGLVIDYEKYKGCIGSTADFLLDIIQREYGRDFHGDEQLLLDRNEIKDEIVRESGIPQIAGVKEMLERVHGAGYQMAVASSSPQVYIDRQMKGLGVDSLFVALCSGEDVENPKPAPDVFLKAAGLLGLKPEECMVIEDSTNGCKAAKAAGMTCIGYYNPDSGEQQLDIADAVIDNYENVNKDFFKMVYEKAKM